MSWLSRARTAYRTVRHQQAADVESLLASVAEALRSSDEVERFSALTSVHGFLGIRPGAEDVLVARATVDDLLMLDVASMLKAAHKDPSSRRDLEKLRQLYAKDRASIASTPEFEARVSALNHRLRHWDE